MEKLKQLYSLILEHKLIYGLILAFIIIVLLFFPQKENVRNIQQAPKIQMSPLAHPQVFPKSGIFKSAGTKNSISLFFNEVIDENTVYVSSSPSISFEIKKLNSASKKIVLLPKTPWINNTTYTITISKGVKSIPASQGESITTQYSELEEDIILEYTIQPTPEPELYPGPI